MNSQICNRFFKKTWLRTWLGSQVLLTDSIGRLEISKMRNLCKDRSFPECCYNCYYFLSRFRQEPMVSDNSVQSLGYSAPINMGRAWWVARVRIHLHTQSRSQGLKNYSYHRNILNTIFETSLLQVTPRLNSQASSRKCMSNFVK